MLRNGTFPSLVKARLVLCRFAPVPFPQLLSSSSRHIDRFDSSISHASKATSAHLAPMAKRKRSTMAQVATDPITASMPLPTFDNLLPPPPKRRASQRVVSKQSVPPKSKSTNPDVNPEVLDGPEALRASPDAEEQDERLDVDKLGMAGRIKDEDDSVPSLVAGEDSDSSLSEMSEEMSEEEPPPPRSKKARVSKATQPTKKQAGATKSQKVTPAVPVKKEAAREPQFLDPEAEGDEEADEEEIQAALSRSPPVHSDYLPLPWKGRLGYVRFASRLQIQD